MTASLKKEISLVASEWKSKLGKIESVYFGGGTPSLLHNRELEDLLYAVRKNFLVNGDAEITLEANPDDINIEILRSWKAAGINRLSVGVQSFADEHLLWMNRAHNANDAEQCIHLVKEEGFSNFSVDLIYGIPGLSDTQWQQNVKKVIDLQIPHVACYALTVESGTALQKMITLKKKADINDEDQSRQFLSLMHWMRENGYRHYEISNYSLPGFQSHHNSSYWKRKNYLGIGPSAHSFDGTKRRWNVNNNALYIQAISRDIIPYEEEILSTTQQLNEYIMTSLRTDTGVNISFVNNSLSTNAMEQFIMKAKQYQDRRFVVQDEGYLKLTDEGKLFADGIAADLFVEND
jgi:oxygen-independent coproporphyrinogen-3 oxidase